MTARAVEPARWRCSSCGQYVPHRAVQIRASDGVPIAECSTCGPRQIVAYVPPGFDPDRAKVEGQQLSIMSMPGVTVASFLEVVESLRVGDRVSVNTIRARLDDLGIPTRARAGLFREAVKRGLLQPLWVEAGGVRVRAVETSTGRTARRAQVRIYERTGE